MGGKAMTNNCTIFKNLFDKTPHLIPIEKALERIKTGKSKVVCEEIRNCFDDEKKSSLKKLLPSICFSGEFKERKDEALIKHNGFLILDWDDVLNIEEKKKELQENKYSYSVWVSPSGMGLKQLVKIADGKKHRQHFKALKKIFPEIDDSGINLSRVAFESYDENIFINEQSEVFKEIIKEEIIVENKIINTSDTFGKLQKWLINSGTAFVSGQRNIFVFKLAAACCRFGLPQSEVNISMKMNYYSTDSDFGVSEMERTIKSAYRANDGKFGTAIFTNEKIYVRETKEEIKTADFSEQINPKDVIYGQDVLEGAMKIHTEGYLTAETTHIPLLDKHWKFKRGEMTSLSGIGNFGKSAWLTHLLLIKTIKENKKWCIFSPEHFPAEEFYHDLTESFFGLDCTPSNPNNPTDEKYLEVYNFISNHFFYIYPKETSATPQYIKEIFLSMIIKEKIDGCIIDPFNQLENDWGTRDDKYLEKVLAEFGRFSKESNTYFFIVAHPTKMQKEDGSYPCPDVFDLANGAMWNNKMDNIMIYHRPDHSFDPTSSKVELRIRKIRRQKIVGVPGVIMFEYNRAKRRFYFENNFSPLEGEKRSGILNFSEPDADKDNPF